MKTLLPALACLVAASLLPLPAAAAEGDASFVTWLPLLLAVVVLIATFLALAPWLKRQRRDKDELALQLHLAEQAVEQAPIPILRLDADLRVVAANQSARQAYAREQASPVGAGLLDLLPELAGHPDIAALRVSGQEQATVSADASPPAGEQHEAPGQLVSLAAQGASRLYWFGTVAAPPQEAPCPCEPDSFAEESARRMKSEFIANINHEVRTPLNAIIGYTEMLANSQLAAKEKRFVAIIHKSSMALVSIFNDIMELSKIDSDRLQITATSVRLQSIVNDVDGLFKDLADEKGIRFTCRVADRLPEYVRFDGVRLKQILQNLVGNAVKFTSEGAVSLTVDGTPNANKPECLDLRFVIDDTGTGISEADQRKIRDLFHQTEEEATKHFGGVGLGLTLCSRLTMMMGGRIELESREGVGSKFILLFDEVPATEPIQVVPEAVPAGKPAQGAQKKLLVVDDVELIKDVFLDFFQDSPYRVFTADTGPEALAIARNERPDLVFMDMNLSGSNGREVTKQLREDSGTASIPVVVMTGHILEEGDYRPLFDAFLQKPFRLEELQNVVDRFVRITAEPQPAPAAAAGESVTVEEDQLLALLGDAWNDELDELRRQAAFSGNLTDAASLGTSMRQRGEAVNQPILTRLGEELLQHAQDPNILGVDRLLAKLSRMSQRSES
ncbi:ATP-binding protein [Desulfobulbus sp.]|uniref:ATP-binding protein n=1 Tax=Desulfobulbus sp. TaxID=895 RepID=UPI00286F965A|nr:ATP-binding protein [Desulfobulbus sp.]